MDTTEEVPSEELETIHVAAGLTRAHVLRAKLEEAGIPVLLSYESLAPVMGIVNTAVGSVRIQVAAEHAEAARALIEGDENKVAGD